MGTAWTKEQQQVIDLRDKDILVSAAAGSGKTAVLVERIIGRLTRETPPVDVDCLLVVTYTEAAAAEMKERIGNAIEKAVQEQPDNVHLKKQSALIHTAKITTIHSFCLSVIKEYFHTIDLDPGFRIAEEGELKLLKQDVMKEMLEARYEAAEEKFLRFVESFATGRGDARLEEIIFTLYEFAGSYPDPEVWLDGCARAYRSEMTEESRSMERAEAFIRSSLSDVLGEMGQARALCRDEDGPYMYEAAVESDEALVKRVLEAGGYDEMFDAFGGAGKVKFDRFAMNRDKNVAEEKTAAVKELREHWKKVIAEVKEAYFFQTPEEMRGDMELCRPVAEMLVELVKEFQQAFAEKKASRNLIDFRDMEQFALRILTKVEDGKRVPSETAREYQEQFVEVMIDEYQDSNLIQEAILTSVSRADRGEHNLFMVGDVKQSIYRFRLSRPELFMEKYHTYSAGEEGDCRRIDLHKNFRSRREVLDTANAIFRQIMTETFGGIAYDDHAALYVGADYPEQAGNETEVLVIDTDSGDMAETAGAGKKGGRTAREVEALAAASRIHRLMEEQQVWDRELGAYRQACYSDIVILTRSLQGWTDVFTKVLNEEGIPTFAGSKEGYFETLEIGWMLDYLRILDNFRQDIPLAAVLKSPFGGCTNEELAEIKASYPDEPFYEAVKKASRESGRLREILEQLEKFEKRVPYTAIHELLWEIADETGYRSYIAAMPGGEQRLANLEMLFSKAKAFESTSYKGLFHFVRYIGQLQKYDVDYGEAGIYDEKTNAVRLMSIHKSKGLEFPIVIAAGMGKLFNTQDIHTSVVIHPELGIGIDAIDLKRRTKCPSLLKKVIQTETGLENLAEELRVLYVALTRAKEKLILTGTVSHLEKKLAELSYTAGNGEESLPFTRLTGARTYYDWVLPAVYYLSPKVPVKLRTVTVSDLVEEEMARMEAEILDKDIYLEAAADASHPLALKDAAFAERLWEQFSYQYPFEGEEQLKLKFTVSELKKRAYTAQTEEEDGAYLVEEEEVIPLVPQFLQEEEELRGASRGSAYHRLLELLDFTREYADEAALEEQIASFLDNGKMKQEEAACIRTGDILRFFHSESGRRMREAAKGGRLYKEQPFVFGVDARELYPETDADEMVLIQGIIDVYFEEDDGIVVLDYKTDRAREGRELVEKYQEQLNLYARALEQLTEKNVIEKMIYSFSLEEEIFIKTVPSEHTADISAEVSGDGREPDDNGL